MDVARRLVCLTKLLTVKLQVMVRVHAALMPSELLSTRFTELKDGGIQTLLKINTLEV